jgi:hypothetical protein
MKISQIIQETSTTAGSVAPVEHGFVKMQTRNPGVYGGNKVGNLLKGKKTNKAFANSVNESAEISETELSEQDLIVVPGQGRSRKNGFVPHGQSRVDHEVEMARSDLIQASKNAEKVYNMIEEVGEDEGLDGWVQEKIIKANDYLNTVREYLEGKEVQGMNEGSQQVDSLVTDSLKIMRGPELDDALRALKTVLGVREYNSRRGFYNFYVKQIIDMYGKQGATESLGTTGAMTNGEMGESQLDELSPKALGSYVKSAASDMANRKGNTQFQKGARVATSAFTSKQSPGRFEKDDKIEKRQAGIDRAVNKMANEGAKVDRMVKHIEKSEEKAGKSKKEAENIAWATANKRGMLDNKNKKK